MARLRRVALPGYPHLIIHRGRNNSPVFVDAQDRASYLDSLCIATRESQVDLHAYGLSPHAVRLLVTPNTVGGLAQLMQSVGRRYVRSYNGRHGCNGSPWEGRFRSTVIEAESYFLVCQRFVEIAGFTDRGSNGDIDVADQPGWSSLTHHFDGRVGSLITDHPVMWTLGNTPFEREAAYRRWISETPSATELASISQASLHGWALGSASFATAVAEQSGRRAKRSTAGRPRKIGHESLASLIKP